MKNGKGVSKGPASFGLVGCKRREKTTFEKTYKRQAKYDRSCLKRTESIAATRDQQSRCNSSFGEGPEHALRPMMILVTVGRKMVDNQRSRVR